ncbi:hypothetical protein [Enterococcus sp. BWR-S5]|uniref:hypothetical protein n=1 Tax=Enterococcus sp. BWR-S5 TaxID=2787714 RepID=UPI001921D8AA|nr:hypothetical protein [Enterococcus sp. BWR-S5]MBL1227214.1 hypothetical protein [Enterococcus sp. BWR-S5]
MEQEKEEKKYLINIDVDSSYEFSRGFGLKQLRHFVVLVLPLLLLIWFFPLKHPNVVVNFLMRLVAIAAIGIVGYNLVKIKRFAGCEVTQVDILEDKMRFKRRMKTGKNVSRYNKLRAKEE